MSNQEKVGVLFGGQGVFEAGMGQTAYRNYARAREIFKEASESAGVDMARVCFGDLTYLQDDPRIVQPAIVTVGLAEYGAWLENNEEPDVVTGLSLGLYPAMAAAEVFQTYGDTVSVVAQRARILYEIHRQRPGKMAGFVGLSTPDLEPILKKTGAGLAIMRDRIRKSVVITGSPEEIEATEEEVKKNGVRKFELLNIFGKFHHGDNAEAQPPFEAVLDSFPMSDPKIKILGNHAIFLDTAAELKAHAVDQLVDQVDWDSVIEEVDRLGVSRIFEAGADDSRGLARQMSKRFKTETIRFPKDHQNPLQTA